jgi:hypothetical protein
MSRNKRNWDQLVQQDGNYGIDISRGIWPGSELQTKGDKGPKGDTGQKGTGVQGRKGDRGEKGFDGNQGIKGDQGDSAYQVAVDEGFTGTELEWINYLKGEEGEKGDQGYSAYDLWLLDGNAGDFDAYLDAIKGNKGSKGDDGEKGDQGGLFTFMGQEGNYQGILDSPGPHNNGDVLQDAETEDLWVWDGTEWVLLVEALAVLQGDKGNVGQKGNEGEKGDRGEQGIKGNTGDKGNTPLDGKKGDKGDQGDSAYEIAVDQGFQGTDTEWIASLHGEDGEDGKSAYQLYADTVTDPNDLLSEGEWLDSLKGDKGDGAAEVDTSQFYTKPQVDSIIAITTPPERSYIFDEMTDPLVVEAGDVLDFRDNNQQLPVYGPGLVQVKTGAVVDNVPLVPPFFLRNTVISSLLSPRGVDHTVLQEIFSAIPDRSEKWFRIAQPGTNTFGDWESGGGFDPQDYYTKSEVSMLVNGQVFYLEARGTEISLRDKIGEDAGTIPLLGVGGIKIRNDGAGNISIDGTDLQNEDKLFLGILNQGEDISEKFPNADTGNFFVFAYEGDAPAEFEDDQGAVPTVKGGDLAYYNKDEDEWNYVESSAGGLLDVTVPENGLLEVDRANPKIPVISLDPVKVVTPDELDPYVTWVGLAQQASERLLGSMKDVNISYTPTTFSGQVFNRVEFSSKLPLGETPDGTPGVYAVDPDNNFLLLAKRDKDGNQVDAIFYNNIDVNADPKQKIRLRTAAGIAAGSDGMIGYITGKAARSNWYELTFDNPAVPLAALQASDLVIDIVTEDTAHGNILSYDSNTSTWETTKGDFVAKTGDTMTGDLNFTDGVDLNFVGDNAGINLESPYYGGLKYDGQLILEWKADAVQTARDINMKLGRVDLADPDAEAQYAGNDQHGGHAIHWLKAPEHKYDATNKQWVENKIQHDINFNNYTELT